MNNAVYPVVISPDDDWYIVRVPDLDRETQGKDIAEAIMMARDLIGLIGITYEDKGKPVPKPSTKEPAHDSGEMVAWVDVDFKRYRLMHDQKSVRMNISIPRYLKALGEETAMKEYDVLFLWDDESQTWVAQNDEIPFCIGSETLEKLMERVKGVAPETLEINGKEYKNIRLNFIIKGVKPAEVVEAVA